MIKVYKIDSLQYTPFDENFKKEDFDYLISNGIEVTTKKESADIYAGSNEKKLLKFLIRNPRKMNYLVWTNEPRLSTNSEKSFRPYFFLQKVNRMNIYTKDVFQGNVTHQKTRFVRKNKLGLLDNDFQFNHRSTVALMSYYQGGEKSKLIIENKNIDLIKIRSQIAIKGFKIGQLEIYGQGWPNGISKENSRRGKWGERKSEILEKFHFNLCFENTVYANYITEKIWDSIENYCLPIYFGGLGSTIYEIFPKQSFIDYSLFKNPQELFDFIQTVTPKEFVERINKCIKVYNDFSEKPISFWDDNNRAVLDRIIFKCRQITGKY